MKKETKLLEEDSCKRNVRYFDFNLKVWRNMFIDVHEISSIDEWDEYSDKSGFTCISFKDSSEISVDKSSYERILHVWSGL